jgi:RNA polymerase sigma-70 factor (ECF subfamily)
VTPEAVATDEPNGLLAVYDSALPHVYGYLAGRVGRGALAEDLTAETFLAAVDAVRAGRLSEVTVGWLVGTARHKLVDHWRRQAREERKVQAVRSPAGLAHDDWDVRLDAVRAHQILATLAPLYRAVLTLRYLDDLSVPAVAEAVDRSLHATEGLLVRARASFRRAYDADEVDDA